MRLAIRAAALAVLAATAVPALAQDLEIPEGGYVVSSDASQLPEAVQKRRLELIAIARGGDISALTAILDADQTTVSFGDPEDRTASLVEASADKKGVETLAILADLLEAPFAAVDGGGGPEGGSFYVWPSLAYYDTLQNLTVADRVIAYQIMGHAGFEEMKELDAWYYWRVYIGPDGQLQAFVAGD
jgi:hypothetical protein